MIAPIQRVIAFQHDGRRFTTKKGKDTNALVEELESMGANNWKQGWKTVVQNRAFDKGTTHQYEDVKELYEELSDKYQRTGTSSRPGFSSRDYRLAKGTHSLTTGTNQQDLSLRDNDLAMPHRFPYADIRDNVMRFVNGTEGEADLIRWTDRLIEATRKRGQLNQASDASQSTSLLPTGYDDDVQLQITTATAARAALIAKSKAASADLSAETNALIKALNSLHGNIPDLGPHNTVNNPVSNRIHLSSNPMSPGTQAALAMTPDRAGRGIATTEDDGMVVTTDGMAMGFDEYGSMIDLFQHAPTTLTTESLGTPTHDVHDVSDDDADDGHEDTVVGTGSHDTHMSSGNQMEM